MFHIICTNIGIRKKKNEDSALYKEAKTGAGHFAMALVCDGLGGLKMGEQASALMTRAASNWFDDELPLLLEDGLTDAALIESLNKLITETDERITSDHNGNWGTTLTAVIAGNGKYMCVNVGDSRVYLITKKGIRQLTHDQTAVQEMVDNGDITPEQANVHPDRNILSQCIGAGGDTTPVYTTGEYKKGDKFLVCSDGFRHMLTTDEMFKLFGEWADTEEEMKMAAERAVDVIMKRKERDNITVVIVKM